VLARSGLLLHHLGLWTRAMESVLLPSIMLSLVTAHCH
jgi:hypothetical protein